MAHAHQVLQHLTNPVAAPVEMRRVLRPGGILAVRDSDYGGFIWAPSDLPPALMAGARQSVRERGKSDPIDALAVARTALREGLQKLPAARLAGPELEIRQLVVHRRRLTDARTRLINELRWQLHDLWPDCEIPTRSLHARPGSSG